MRRSGDRHTRAGAVVGKRLQKLHRGAELGQVAIVMLGGSLLWCGDDEIHGELVQQSPTPGIGEQGRH
jgi:hypothetical protein